MPSARTRLQALFTLARDVQHYLISKQGGAGWWALGKGVGGEAGWYLGVGEGIGPVVRWAWGGGGMGEARLSSS